MGQGIGRRVQIGGHAALMQTAVIAKLIEELTAAGKLHCIVNFGVEMIEHTPTLTHFVGKGRTVVGTAIVHRRAFSEAKEATFYYPVTLVYENGGPGNLTATVGPSRCK